MQAAFKKTRQLLRALALVLLGLSAEQSLAQSADEIAAVSAAMDLVAKEDWEGARAAAMPAGAVGEAIVDWFRLRAGAGEFDEYRAFLSRHSDWPGLPLMQQRGEAAIPRGADPQAVIAYFSSQPPRTGKGALRLAEAYEEIGKKGDAEAEVVRAWRSLSLSGDERKSFLQRYAKLLVPHHVARQDMLFWRGLIDEANRMNDVVPPAHRTLMAARTALMNNKNGVTRLLAKVPGKLAADAGLAFARFQWRLSRGMTDGAEKLLLERSISAAALGQPAAWADQRRSLARQAMRDGKPDLAYKLASRHFLQGGDDYADLEWLSGYIALTRLNKPDLALKHFYRFRAAVDTPISLGRAGYWEGRAHEALGNAEEANLAYAFGGEYQTSFYGLLAAEKAGLPMKPELAGRETYPDWKTSRFANSTVLQAALLFEKAGHPLLFTRFLRHLAETLTWEERGSIAQLALDLNEPYAAVYLAKYAADNGHVLWRPYFPVTPIIDSDQPVPPELILSIARRESEFFPRITSPAGARGLMQLMPRTGKAMASRLDIRFDADRLLDDPAYNARLGTAYLAELIETYGHFYPFIAVAYNAGPSRVEKWARMFGDPRRGADTIDWIESIPFRETRNYVMRVMESLIVYRARLTGKTGKITLAEELKWPGIGWKPLTQGPRPPDALATE